MNKANTRIEEDKYLSIYNKKIKQIKMGVIIAIIIVIAIVAAYTINEIYHNWVDLVIQQYYIRFQEGEINSDTYYSLKQNLEFNQDFFQWISLIIANSGKVLLNIGFLFIILGLLSITTDRALKKKLRRTTLILAVSLFIFMIFFIFVILLKDVEVVVYYPPIFLTLD